MDGCGANSSRKSLVWIDGALFFEVKRGLDGWGLCVSSKSSVWMDGVLEKSISLDSWGVFLEKGWTAIVGGHIS